MRIALLTALTMVAFAANSILTRLAIDGGYMDPAGFALVRVAGGALMLALLLLWRGGAPGLITPKRLPGVFALAAYMVGFSLAYLTLDAGLGALILFGVVQITMFAHGVLRGAAPSARQLAGAGVAFSGLLIALWPGAGSGSDPFGAALMVFAGLGWAAYTIRGRGAADPLATTAANFLLCLPIMFVLLLGSPLVFSAPGLALGLICGAVTSGLGYALWYAVLPRLEGNTAAIVQLSVPIIAILGGALLLGEPVSATLALAAALVVGGIAWAVSAGSVPAGRR